MSKNTDRYKDDFKDFVTEDDLLEIETRSFEKFAPKKKRDDKFNKNRQNRNDIDQEDNF